MFLQENIEKIMDYLEIFISILKKLESFMEIIISIDNNINQNLIKSILTNLICFIKKNVFFFYYYKILYDYIRKNFHI